MKIKIFVVIVICAIATLGYGQNCPTTNIRGRVLTNNYGQNIAIHSAKVDLYVFNAGMPKSQQWKLVQTTYTDAYGYFYFNNIPHKNYTIWINQKKSYNIQVIPIDCAHVSYQDLPQFLF